MEGFLIFTLLFAFLATGIWVSKRARDYAIERFDCSRDILRSFGRLKDADLTTEERQRIELEVERYISRH